jgi:hypothetical protein
LNPFGPDGVFPLGPPNQSYEKFLKGIVMSRYLLALIAAASFSLGSIAPAYAGGCGKSCTDCTNCSCCDCGGDASKCTCKK